MVPDCATELERLYGAIMALASGRATVSVSFGERSVTYAQAQRPELVALFRLFHASCGAAAGIPDITAAAAVGRGPPAAARF